MAYKFNIFTGTLDIVPNAEKVTTQASLANNWSLTIDLTAPKQTFYISAAAGANSSSTTPFGATAPLNGAEITLIGADDDLFPSISGNDGAKGILGLSVYPLNRGESVTFKYVAAIDRYVLIGKSN